MISDYVKGNKQFAFSAGIQKGIRLHRAIDDFTDAHTVTRQLKSYFHPVYRLYSGAFADIVYDHFLANDTSQFPSSAHLKEFTTIVYKVIRANDEVLPPAFSDIFSNMAVHDWLYNYKYTWGIEKSFGGLVRRSAYLTDSTPAFNIFSQHYTAMQCCYEEFFPKVKNFAMCKLQQLLNN